MGQCQAAVAEAVEAFGKLDILLCCSSEGSALHGFSNEVKKCTEYTLQRWSARWKSWRLRHGPRLLSESSLRRISSVLSIASKLHYRLCGKEIVGIL